MTKAFILPIDAPIRRLGNIPPIRRGPGGIEAQSSLITRLALHHECAPYTLFSTVIVPHKERLNRHWKRIRWGESHLVNGYGEVAGKISAILSDCTGRPDIAETTFAGLGDLCDPKGKHFLHQVRPWCSECYKEARQRNIAAWDALYTYPRTTKVCAWHEIPLSFACPQCLRAQRFVPKFPLLDFCEHCGADLTMVQVGAIPTEGQLREQLWIARSALDIIKVLGSDKKLAVSHFFDNIRLLMETHFGGQEQAFARRLGLAGSSPKNWLKRGSAPTWASLVDLGYRLDVPPSHLGSAELTLTDPEYWRVLPTQSLDRPHVRPSPSKLKEIHKALKLRLRIKQIDSAHSLEGVRQIAKRLGVLPSTIKRHFPREYAQVIEQRSSLFSTLRVHRNRQKESRITAAIMATKASRRAITTRNLKKTGMVKVSDVVTGS